MLCVGKPRRLARDKLFAGVFVEIPVRTLLAVVIIPQFASTSTRQLAYTFKVTGGGSDVTTKVKTYRQMPNNLVQLSSSFLKFEAATRSLWHAFLFLLSCNLGLTPA